ncbi:flagellar biosynthesis protein FlhB [Temperatibacter marinus]|uniref:Flagellar biosynthetic protein FlhB n=1 Tax=Temperatibacter marinus TaxID=1456591 RepID=A0AA52EFG9_9PROT|nr:flagellar biosynthesis protein FlhB [Temperatibacter marinus]WND02148.1 flagellar biosynthesis protein FlhB [Temperatibacter marinus]
MADEDQDSKTEEATPKKLEDAKKKGQVLQSQEIKNWFAFLGMVVIFVGWIPILASAVFTELKFHLSNIDLIPFGGQAITNWMIDLILVLALYLSVPAGVIILMTLIATRAQHEFIFTLEKLKPNFKKLDPIQGSKKFFSAQILIELVKTILKLIFVSTVTFLLIFPQRDKLDEMLTTPTASMIETVYYFVLQLLIAMLLLVTIIAFIDYTYQRYKFYKGLMMTKQEVKDEHKQSDGDPQVKGRLRKIRMERAMQRMMSSVPNADVVVTNPTHFAVALEYKHGQMDVPVLLAKGVDNIAFKIREVAEEHGVPIMEDPPLARLLYATVEIDQEIPPEHYKAVAGIISRIIKLGKTRVNMGRTP